MSLKILTYNTLFGGLDGAGKTRAEKIVELINERQPDIFLMQEAKAYDADGGGLLYALERNIGMRGFLAQAPHTGQNTAIFIRKPLRAKSFTPDAVHFHHALARLVILLPDGKELTVMSAHLCPNGAIVRRREAAYLAPLALPDKLVLVGGDFNSVSPHDREPQDFGALPAQHRTRYLGEDLQTIDRSVMASLDAAGWIDVGHQLGGGGNPTVPTPAYKDTEFATMRCDYLLASKALAETARHYEVIKTPLTDVASDHYPIFAEFEI